MLTHCSLTIAELAEATKSNSMNTVAVKRPRIELSTRGKRGSFDSISSSDSVTGSFKRKIRFGIAKFCKKNP